MFLTLMTIPYQRVPEAIIVVTVDSSIRFPAIDYVNEKFDKMFQAESHDTKLVLDFSRVNQIDYTVVQGLSDLMVDLRRAGVTAVFANVLVSLLALPLKPFGRLQYLICLHPKRVPEALSFIVLNG